MTRHVNGLGIYFLASSQLSMHFFQERCERGGGHPQAGGRPDQVLRGLAHLNCDIGYVGRGRETRADWWVIQHY